MTSGEKRKKKKRKEREKIKTSMCFQSLLLELPITNVGMNEMKVNIINIKVCHG